MVRIMIAGARELRTPTHVDPVAVVIREPGHDRLDAGLLEHGRDGDGAPSERRNGSVSFGRLRIGSLGRHTESEREQNDEPTTSSKRPSLGCQTRASPARPDGEME
jgi:hypothetical protein